MKWDKVFKNGPSKICGRQHLKNSKGYGLLKRPYVFKFFKGCLHQILLGPLLNTLSQIKYVSKAEVLFFPPPIKSMLNIPRVPVLGTTWRMVILWVDETG